MARPIDGMEVFVRGRRCRLACAARDAGKTQAASGGDQLAFGEETLLDEDQECRRFSLPAMFTCHAMARCDGAWLCTAAGPHITFRGCLSHKKSQADFDEAEVDPGAAKGKR